MKSAGIGAGLIALVALLGASVKVVIIAIAIPEIPRVTRLVRSVVLSVRDHGPGLSPEERARATDRFWRAPDAPPGGTGLGLAIVSELATVSGGGVTLDDPDEGPGLVVRVRLPHSA